MFTTSSQHYLKNKGLNLKEAFLLNVLKSLMGPIKMATIVNLYPHLEIKERQYFNILNKLEKANLLVKYANSSKGITFFFPFVTPAKNCRCKPFSLCKKLQGFSRYPCKKLQVKPDIINNKNNKNNIYKLHYVVDIGSVGVNKKNSKTSIIMEIEIKKAFSNAFPDKNNFIKAPLPNFFNIDLLIEKINESDFLKNKPFITLNWCIINYQTIISGFYKTYANTPSHSPARDVDFTEREYTREELNNLFDPLDDL